MAKLIPKENIPKPPNPIAGLRVFTKEEALARSKARREGKYVDREPPADLLPADAYRKRSRHQVTLAPGYASSARKLGRGNLSRGLDAAVEFWLAHRKRGRKPNVT